MRGHFSIEWMSQSSRPTGTGTGPAACGTHSESLPGFYCRQKSESSPERREAEAPRLQNPSRGTETGFSSGTEEEEETSGYESEGGRSLSPPASAASASPPPPPPGRRPRTAFTAEQIGSLERSFKRNAYLGTQDKAELCKKLQLSDKQIRNWFQNRRMKLKRTVQDALAHACHADAASRFLHHPELQACRPAPYRRYPPAPQDAAPGSAPYFHPHGLQCGSAAPALPSLHLDPFCQYAPPYAAYPQYY
ncbi:ventrally expressed dharma/bozozok antagonist [Gasterosteus aculeatus]